MANPAHDAQGTPFLHWLAEIANTGYARHNGNADWQGPDASADPWHGGFGYDFSRHSSYPEASRGHRGPPPPHHGGPHHGPHHGGQSPPPPPPAEGDGASSLPPPPHHDHAHHERHGPHRGRHNGRGRGCHGRGGPFGGRRGASPFDGPQTGAENPFAAIANMFGLGGQGFGGQGFDMSQLRDQFESHFGLNTTANNKNADADSDFTPLCDVFDKPDAYVVHFSLPGAKKEDISCNWDADKHELHVAGVIYRPADEETLKTLAMNERNVGVFGRRIKLGSKGSPANIDSDAITAKMEDGILIVNVPKNEEFVEIKKVDIE